nr:hypothetical protein [Tanacetum cinerariifolium]
MDESGELSNRSKQDNMFSMCCHLRMEKKKIRYASNIQESVNGKKYILVIVDDYSRFTWLKFLRSKDETPDFIIKFLKMIQVRLKVPVRLARSPQQNRVVERRNRTLIEAARAMLIYAQAPLFLWAGAVATTCFTQNRSIIRLRHRKTSYEILHSKLHDLSFFHVFDALCYPTNDSENLGNLQPKADIRIFIGYAPTKKALRIYNRRTRRIMETIHVDFDELMAMASEHRSSGPMLNEMTPGTITIAPIAEVIPLGYVVSTGSPSSTTVEQDAPSTSNSPTPTETQSSVIPQDVGDDNLDMEVAHMGNDSLFGVPIPEVTSAQSTTPTSPQAIVKQITQCHITTSTNDVMLATMNQIVNLLSGFQKQFPPTNNQHRTSTNLMTQATIQAGQITTESVQRRAPGNKEAEAFLAGVECTAHYDDSLSITTTTTFKVSHEDAYDSNVDEAPHAVAAFITNLTGTSTREGTSNDTNFHSEEEQLDFDVDLNIDDYDNIIPYHQYQSNTKVKNIPTEVSPVLSDQISMSTILDDMRLKLEGYMNTNKEQSLTNDSLKAKLERYKTQVPNLEQYKVKRDLEQLVTKHNKQNANLEEQIMSLKQQLSQQLKEELTAVRIKNDSLRDENMSIKARFQELCKSKAGSNSSVSSGATILVKPKAVAFGLYAMTPKNTIYPS